MSAKVTTLDEVVVSRKRNKYTKHNNPAYELMTKIREHKDDNNPRNQPQYSYDYYDKLVLGINSTDVEAITDRSKFRFMRQLIDTGYTSPFPVMLLSLREKTGTRLFSSRPKYEKDIIRARRNAGIDEAFNQDNINIVLNDVLRNVDIYENDITLMQNRFVSPIGRLAGDFYMYSLNDTITGADGRKYLELVFTPHTPETFGFIGRMFVDASDSTYFVKSVSMKVPRVINLNYIDNIYINQEFERDSIGNRHKVSEDISLELNIVPGSPSFFGHRLTAYDNFSYHNRPDMQEYIDRLGTMFVYPEADKKTWEEWESLRAVPLTPQESNIGNAMTRLRSIPVIYWGEQVLKILVNGYVATGKKSKIDLGPVNTLISYNHLEGVRLRVGGVTTADLSPHWFGRGYIAYGFKDRKFKYDAEIEYSFLPKKVHAREFPVHLLRARYKYELDMIGQRYFFTNQDNVFLSLKRHQSDLGLYKRDGAIDYELEMTN
ncbi:MAG: carboxypeptidase-like regulatory domain-containing protein, partial [Muribaculaceae bacterium]|nr:carboxypeptidase-like regulatory domain-containing protein [Muribaculaceae bacterium]